MQVNLEQEQVDRLHALSARTRVPMNVYVRRGLELELNLVEAELARSPEGPPSPLATFVPESARAMKVKR